MLYSEKYPNAKLGEEVENGVMCGYKADNCAQCGRLTDFVEMNYQAHFCSGECIDAFDAELFKNANKHKSNKNLYF